VSHPDGSISIDVVHIGGRTLLQQVRRFRIGGAASGAADPHSRVSVLELYCECLLLSLTDQFGPQPKELARRAHALLERITDPYQRFSRHRRRMRLFQIVELAPHMRPARSLLNAAIFVELIESRVGIGLQRATKLLQMLRGMLDGDLTLASAAVRAAKDALPAADQAAMLAQLAQMQFGAADFTGMTATAARLGELSDAITDPEVALGPRRRVAIWRGDLAEAHRLADELARRTRAAGPHISSHALGVQAWQAEYEGDWATVRRLAGEFLALAQANEGTVFCAGGGSPVLAAGSIAEARAGRMDEARALLDRARAYIHEPDEPPEALTESAGDEFLPIEEEDREIIVHRHTVFTARYRHTLKGHDRGKWEVEVTAEADAPLVTVDEVVRGVMKRAGEPFEPEKISASAFKSIVAGIPAGAGGDPRPGGGPRHPHCLWTDSTSTPQRLHIGSSRRLIRPLQRSHSHEPMARRSIWTARADAIRWMPSTSFALAVLRMSWASPLWSAVSLATSAFCAATSFFAAARMSSDPLVIEVM